MKNNIYCIIVDYRNNNEDNKNKMFSWIAYEKSIKSILDKLSNIDLKDVSDVEDINYREEIGSSTPYNIVEMKLIRAYLSPESIIVNYKVKEDTVTVSVCEMGEVKVTCEFKLDTYKKTEDKKGLIELIDMLSKEKSRDRIESLKEMLSKRVKLT